MTDKTAVANSEPPDVIEIKICLGVNKDKWRQYLNEEYDPASIEEMFKDDVRWAISYGASVVSNKLIDGNVVDIAISEYY